MNHLFSFLFLSALAVLSSCGESVLEDDSVPTDELIPREDITLTKAEAEYVQANNSFALELFKNASETEKEKSMLLSPLSVTFALGMVGNGAVGQTKEEIDKTLGFGEDAGSMNEFCSKMLKESVKVDPSTTIEIANAAVVNNMRGGKLKDDFTKAIESHYAALVYSKDFSKEDIKGFVNKWCAEKTHGMIPELLKEQVKPSEFAHFLNATYFKGIWSSQFKKSDTKKEDFHLEDGSKASVNMMRQKSKFNYIQLKSVGSAVCLPYGNQAFRMIVILPDEGKTISDLKTALDIKAWNSVVSYMSSREVDVKLPSFETEYSIYDMAEILSDMGIHKAFTQGADFSGMTSVPVHIDKVIHKAKIKVDEQGSEAAAVTDVVMKENSATPTGPVEFHADRPFIYAITEVSTGAIFFIGQYTGK